MNDMKKVLNRVVKNSVVMLGVGCYFFVVGMLLFGANGFAYIDPSVMTYVIQAVSGIVIAIGAAVGIYWRKAKKKISEKLDIEEKKEVESDDIKINKEKA